MRDAACWLGDNPNAEITTVEAWAEAKAGGNQLSSSAVKQHSRKEPDHRENLKDLLLSTLEKAEADIDKDKVLMTLLRTCVIYTPRAGANYQSMVQRVRELWPWEHATNGIIFEFKDIERAKTFAAAVKEKWALSSRVFDVDEVEAAELAYLYPFGQEPPVVHVDRPVWILTMIHR